VRSNRWADIECGTRRARRSRERWSTIGSGSEKGLKDQIEVEEWNVIALH
jgi:hypothetical protein